MNGQCQIGIMYRVHAREQAIMILHLAKCSPHLECYTTSSLVCLACAQHKPYEHMHTSQVCLHVTYCITDRRLARHSAAYACATHQNQRDIILQRLTAHNLWTTGLTFSSSSLITHSRETYISRRSAGGAEEGQELVAVALDLQGLVGHHLGGEVRQVLWI